MNFSDALKELKLGKKLQRSWWPKENYIYIEKVRGGERITSIIHGCKLSPFLFHDEDVLAEDWDSLTIN